MKNTHTIAPEIQSIREDLNGIRGFIFRNKWKVLWALAVIGILWAATKQHEDASIKEAIRERNHPMRVIDDNERRMDAAWEQKAQDDASKVHDFVAE